MNDSKIDSECESPSKINNFSFLVFFFSFFISSTAFTQSIVGNHFSSKGSGVVVLSYAQKQYTEFWAGDKIMTAPKEGLNQYLTTIYAQYALTDAIEVVASVPYASNISKNKEDKYNGIQSVSLFAKGKLYATKNFTAGVAAGTHIAPDYNPGALYSLGNGSSSFDAFALLSYKTPIGISINAQGGYSLKTEEEVPNAALWMAGLAYAHKYFYVRADYGIQRSSEGLDIGSEQFGGPVDFPKAKVNYDQIMFSAYVPIAKCFALTGSYGNVVDGRNIGDYSYFSFGLALKWK